MKGGVVLATFTTFPFIETIVLNGAQENDDFQSNRRAINYSKD